MGENNSKETIFCGECHAEIPKDNKFCSKCGKPVKTEPKESETNEIKCPKCQAELKPGIRFCTDCGTKVEGQVEDAEQKTCPKCYAEVKPGLRFCTECGGELPVSKITIQPSTCPKCYAELEKDLKFCTECGAEIKQVSTSSSTCPKCYSDVTPGLMYCTECGTSLEAGESVSSANINEKLRQKRESGEYQTSGDENVDELVNTGKNVMKGIGGLLNRAKGDFDHMLKSSDTSYNQPNQGENNQIKTRIKPKTNGYLVCDKCQGFYELGVDESPDNFQLECECGGKLEFKESLSEK